MDASYISKITRPSLHLRGSKGQLHHFFERKSPKIHNYILMFEEGFTIHSLIDWVPVKMFKGPQLFFLAFLVFVWHKVSPL